MDLSRLYGIMAETTTVFRKGEAVVKRTTGSMDVTEIYNMPHQSNADDNLKLIDCHFIVVGVNMVKAQEIKDELLQILDSYPESERLKDGPSYIEVGGNVGDQQIALQLFALGQALDLWTVITPETLGIEGSEAHQLAGMGMVMISGYQK